MSCVPSLRERQPIDRSQTGLRAPCLERDFSGPSARRINARQMHFSLQQRTALQIEDVLASQNQSGQIGFQKFNAFRVNPRSSSEGYVHSQLVLTSYPCRFWLSIKLWSKIKPPDMCRIISARGHFPRRGRGESLL